MGFLNICCFTDFESFISYFTTICSLFFFVLFAQIPKVTGFLLTSPALIEHYNVCGLF